MRIFMQTHYFALKKKDDCVEKIIVRSFCFCSYGQNWILLHVFSLWLLQVQSRWLVLDLFSNHRRTPHPAQLSGCSRLNSACYTLLPLGGESGTCTTSRGENAILKSSHCILYSNCFIILCSKVSFSPVVLWDNHWTDCLSNNTRDLSVTCEKSFFVEQHFPAKVPSPWADKMF